ncbi:alpha/beta hydrolase [Taklimakanibacter deserti]|uniref:alpha/beta hydrolase n=1 Tax=Taklimakanibacter deserti TaxID=2267839 RepID=UPI000E64714A
MRTFVLIHGARDVGWYWHLVEANLRRNGHDVVAPDLPCTDDAAGFSDYADTVIEAIGERSGLVVVGQSLGAYTAPLICARKKADLLVLVAGLVPAPGEAAADWWTNTGYGEEVHGRYTNDIELFYHDVPADLAAEALHRGRHQSETPMRDPWPLAAWPDVPTRFILCRDDRLLPEAFLRRVVRDRLGITPDEIDAGHCVALSRPQELADRLEKYLA